MEYELENVALTLRETPYVYNTNLRQRDKGFKVLFEVKSQFIQLVKTFVKGDWVNELNEENIELADKELVLRFKVRKELKKYMPNFEYILIDINNYTDEELTNTANLISSVFFLTKSKNPSEVASRIKELVETAGKLTVEEQKALSKWAKTIFIKNTDIQECIDENFYIKEDEEMTLEDFLPDTVIEMIKEGKAEGEEKGKSEGKLFSIMRLLKKKLKSSPSEEIVKKLESLSNEKLDEVIDSIFSLNSWEEVEEILND